MKERPILFCERMVQALLSDSKTQTRRVAKLTDAAHVKARLACPYGQPGDRLWVRETFAEGIHQLCDADHWVYAVDPFAHQYRLGNKWKPSIFMPRVASRITLDITAVRIERLQDISEADAIAEGVKADPWPEEFCSHDKDARTEYQYLWRDINGEGSWESNPLVWVITFKQVFP